MRAPLSPRQRLITSKVGTQETPLAIASSNQLSTLPRQIFNPLPIVRSELEFRRSHVLLEMRERRCARDRQHDRRFLQQPGESELHDANVVTLCFGVQWIAGLA